MAPVFPVLHDSEAIRARVAALARDITSDYEGREIDLVYMINGAATFAADLVRHLGVPVRVHPLGFSSYPGAPKNGEVRVTLDVPEPLQDRHVLVVEGLVVSGRTPRYLVEMIRLRNPASLALCVLGTKPRTLAVPLDIKYSAFEFGDEMAAGYGVGKGPEKTLPDIVDLRQP
jgi:hypoxanthine phosphoribosyltransferase